MGGPGRRAIGAAWGPATEADGAPRPPQVATGARRRPWVERKRAAHQSGPACGVQYLRLIFSQFRLELPLRPFRPMYCSPAPKFTLCETVVQACPSWVLGTSTWP